MKYKFEKTIEDNYKLTYKDKEFTFKSNVNITKELQNLIVEARKQIIFDLTQQGKSVKDLTIEKKINGKTYFDNSNKVAYEQIYYEQVMVDYLDKKSNELFGMSIEELMKDIGLETSEEGEKFGVDFMNCLSGRDFPKAQ